MMSCGGGSSSTTVLAAPPSILGINVCAGAPPSPTPVPTLTNGHADTDADSDLHSTIVTSGAVCAPNSSPFCGTMIGGQTAGTTVSFNAQGFFGFLQQLNSVKFRDVSGRAIWNTITPNLTFPGSIIYLGDGEFVGVTTGCTYFVVSDGGFLQSILVGVNVDPATCPAPPAATLERPESSQPTPSSSP